MEAIKDTVANIIQDLKAKKARSNKGGPSALLKNALTKKELEHIKVNYLKKGILNINVDSSTWLYSLSLKKEDILARLNKPGSQTESIKDIRFRIGEVK